MDHPELEQLPEELREAVEKYLKYRIGAKILSTEITETMHYRDKPPAKNYRIFIEYENLLVVFNAWMRTDGGFACRKDSMTVGEIEFSSSTALGSKGGIKLETKICGTCAWPWKDYRYGSCPVAGKKTNRLMGGCYYWKGREV